MWIYYKKRTETDLKPHCYLLRGCIVMAEPREKVVTATDFTKNFAEHKEDALRRGVIVKSHKREILAVIPIDVYRRLKKLEEDNRRAYGVDDIPDDLRAALLESAKEMQKG